MNQRIQELAAQCWQEVIMDFDYHSRSERVFNRGKFAELIVQECLSFIEHDIAFEGTTAQIKEHFGIEE